MIGCPDCGGPANQPADGCTNPIHGEAGAKVIRMAPDAEGVMHLLPENEVLMDDEALEAVAVGHALYKFIAEQGAHFSLVHDHKHPGPTEWSVMLNFGEESPGSPMAAGSAIGDGASALDAIKGALTEAGVEWEAPNGS